MIKEILEEVQDDREERKIKTFSIWMGVLDRLEYFINCIIWPFFQVVEYFRKRKWRRKKPDEKQQQLNPGTN